MAPRDLQTFTRCLVCAVGLACVVVARSARSVSTAGPGARGLGASAAASLLAEDGATATTPAAGTGERDAHATPTSPAWAPLREPLLRTAREDEPDAEAGSVHPCPTRPRIDAP